MKRNQKGEIVLAITSILFVFELLISVLVIAGAVAFADKVNKDDKATAQTAVEQSQNCCKEKDCCRK